MCAHDAHWQASLNIYNIVDSIGLNFNDLNALQCLMYDVFFNPFKQQVGTKLTVNTDL